MVTTVVVMVVVTVEATVADASMGEDCADDVADT